MLTPARDTAFVSANLDLVRSIFAPWERGDWSASEWASSQIELVVMDGPSPGSWTGVAAWMSWIDDFLTEWEGYRLGAEEYRELDGERVLVLVRASGGRGRISGLELGQQGGGGATLIHLRDGKVTRLVVYFVRDSALADLGLAPDAGSER
jgi:ketosteroid isomerase-like protein